MEECLSCQSISGVKRISPGPTIHEGHYWLVEHAYPSKLKGWLVIVLKRHAEALHELELEELEELARLTHRVTRLLRQTLGCEKEYMMCIAEGQGFKHIHVHLVPKPPDLPPELKGPRIFALIAVDESQAAPPGEVRALCEDLRAKF